MKSLVLASLLGAVGGMAVPAIGGPFHFQVTRPHALFGMLSVNASGTTSVSLGQLPHDFVLTDVVVGGYYDMLFVTVNGANVMNAPRYEPGSGSSTHLQSGVFIPAGSTIGVQALGGLAPYFDRPVTISGYLQ